MLVRILTSGLWFELLEKEERMERRKEKPCAKACFPPSALKTCCSYLEEELAGVFRAVEAV